MFKAIVVLLHMYDYIIFPVQYLLIQFFCMPRCYFQNLPSSYNAKCSVYTNYANVSLSWLCENAQPAHIFGVVNILLTIYANFTQNCILLRFCSNMLQQVTMHFFSDFVALLYVKTGDNAYFLRFCNCFSKAFKNTENMKNWTQIHIVSRFSYKTSHH